MQNDYQKIRIFYRKRECIKLIRPLLSLNRLQILKICVFYNLPIYIDSTNQQVNFRRNRIRHQVYPILKIFFNPKMDFALMRLLSIINSEENYFRSHLKILEKYIKGRKIFLNKNLGGKWIIFLPNALQRKLYQRLLISNFKSLTFDEVEFLLRLNICNFK